MKIKTIALIAALAMPLAAWGQDKTDTTDKTTDKSKTAGKEKLASADLLALAHFHHINQVEIDAGRMAQKQGSTQAVKAYGQMLVKDHQTADKDLTAFAKKQGVTIPMDKPKDEADQRAQQDMKDAMTKLKTLKGADFDTAFLQQMVQDHEKALADIDSAIGVVQNQDLVAILKDIKPLLQKHEDQARDLQKTTPSAMK